ncbi:MAG: hypothetical protein IJO74_03380 [Clostridia bacterium]|nr:hypothetical protein [Clostridia bacterium]
MNNLKKTVFFLFLSVICFILVSCSSDVDNTAVLDGILLEKLSGVNLADTFLIASEEINEDPVSKAFENKDPYFSGVYTTEEKIYKFFPDGTLDTYLPDGVLQRLTYSIVYPDQQNTAIKLVISGDGQENEFRFKKSTGNGFDAVLIDQNGNDGNVHSFLYSSFYESFIDLKPFFEETLYNSGVVWMFTQDGFLRAIDEYGNTYTYLFNLDYVTNDDGVVEKYLLIGENVGHDNEVITRLKITNYSPKSITTKKIVDGEEADEEIVFTM